MIHFYLHFHNKRDGEQTKDKHIFIQVELDNSDNMTKPNNYVNV